MNSNSPHHSTDEPIMRPVEELEQEDGSRPQDTAHHAAQMAEAEGGDGQIPIVGVAPFQAGAQLTPAVVPTGDLLDTGRDRVEERREDDV